MSQLQLDVYLFFKDSKCKEAMEFYKSVFGGELTMQSYDEMPGDKAPNSEGKIMHAALKGGAIEFMASDSTSEGEFGRSAISISVGGDDEVLMRDLFPKLAEGGTIDYPLEKQFWGDIHGAITDKYGFEWMFNVSEKKDEAASS